MVPPQHTHVQWGVWVGAIATSLAVVVALWQSYKTRKEAEQVRKDTLRPILNLDWVDAHVSVDSLVNGHPQLERVSAHVTNVGTGPALNAYAEFRSTNNTAVTNGLGSERSSVLPEYRPVIHIQPGAYASLVADVTSQQLPTDISVRIVYTSIFGKTDQSDWHQITIGVARSQRIAVPDFKIPNL